MTQQSTSPDRGTAFFALAPISLRLCVLFAGVWVIASVIPALSYALALPPTLPELAARPYSLVTYWLFHMSLGHLAQSFLGVVAYGIIIEPRLSRNIVRLLVPQSVFAGGLLYCSVPSAKGPLVGAFTVAAGFGGAALACWLRDRTNFVWWEHLIVAYAAFACALMMLSSIGSPRALVGLLTVLAGGVLAFMALRRAGA